METKNKRNANASEVDNDSCKHYIRVSKKQKPLQFWDFEFTNSRLLSINLAINTNYLVLRVLTAKESHVQHSSLRSSKTAHA